MIRAAVALAAVLALFPERSAAVDVWPFYVSDREPVAGVATTRALGPLFESWAFEADAVAWERIARGARYTVRPLFSRGSLDQHGYTEFLYPLGRVQGEDYGTSGRLTPLARWGAKGEDDAHRYWTAGPAYGGTTEEGARYGGLFPLFGRAVARFGKASLSFVLFPIYGTSLDRKGFERHTVLWPFFARGEGGGRELFRIWPIYGYDRREGDFDRRFALWPFVFWRRDRIDRENERHARFVLPVWGRSESADTTAGFIGGPLYVHSEHRPSGATSVDAPWPIYRRAEKPGRDGEPPTREIRFWPFFRKKSGPGWSETSLLLGLVRWRTGEEDGERRTTRSLLFVSRFEDRENPETGEVVRTRNLWPLYRRSERIFPDGRRFARMVAPWPLPLADEGFHRHLLGVLSLYEATSTESEERSDWLWGFARKREKPGYRFRAFGWWAHEERDPLARRVATAGDR